MAPVDGVWEATKYIYCLPQCCAAACCNGAYSCSGNCGFDCAAGCQGQKQSQPQPYHDTFPTVINRELEGIVKQQKDLISEHSHNKAWDTYKKLANDYELVHTSTRGSVAACTPVSRSFFKLWEMLCDLEPQMGLRARQSCRATFLAEGPGGFIEAFCHYRGRDRGDAIYGVTLLSTSRNVPSWKLQQDLVEAHNVKLLDGADGTGSLLHPANVEQVVQDVGAAMCDLVTADGGFDFSGSYNDQEAVGMQLIQAEVCTALQLQAPGGHFCLKLFDMFTPRSCQLLYVLNLLYRAVYIIKPLTSRPANSERYVMCVDFKGHSDPQHRTLLADVVRQLQDTMQTNMWCLRATPCIRFLYDLAEYNAYYMIRQVLHIQRTVNLITWHAQSQAHALMQSHAQSQSQSQSHTQSRSHLAQLNNMQRAQQAKAEAWCRKYGIPFRPRHVSSPTPVSNAMSIESAVIQGLDTAQQCVPGHANALKLARGDRSQRL